MIRVETLAASQLPPLFPPLVDILVDVVDGGASVHFLSPLAQGDAHAFWQKIAAAVAADDRVLFGAFDGDDLVGTVQLCVDTPPNQPHRAEIAKLLVHSRARRRGVARALMDAAENEARSRKRTLLTLDTVTGSVADGLYRKLGYTPIGIIPDYALLPSGESLASTTIFYKRL